MNQAQHRPPNQSIYSHSLRLGFLTTRITMAETFGARHRIPKLRTENQEPIHWISHFSSKLALQA
jgi:hypothetical protein